MGSIEPMPKEPAIHDKASWRSLVRERLAELSPAERQDREIRARSAFLGHPLVHGAERLCICLSFGAELNTWPLIPALAADGRQLFVPRVDVRSREMSIHPYPCPLETLSTSGLRQPRRETPRLEDDEIVATLDVMLVLGVAFDRRGFRLGSGGGYFDRFLAGRPIPTVALAFDLQVVDELPTESHDVPMRALVTESLTTSFR